MARLEQVNNKAERKVEEAMLETKKARAELYKFKSETGKPLTRTSTKGVYHDSLTKCEK